MSQVQPTKIFISYRRDDTSGHAGRLYDDLTERFGEDRVFIDIDKIEPGVDFGESIERALDSCEVVLVVIGKSWLKITDSNGLRRLDNPDDYVRMELEAALARGVRVIPVRVQGAGMPSSTELPKGLAPLARRQAVELSDNRWRYDVGVLAAAVERVAAENAARALDERDQVVVAQGEQAATAEQEVDAAHEPTADAGFEELTPPVVTAATAPVSARTEPTADRSSGAPRSYGRWLALAGGVIALGLAALIAVVALQARGDGQGARRAGTPIDTTPSETAEKGQARREPRTVSLVRRLIPPGPPYRCVSPFHRDHDGAMTLLLQSANGTRFRFASRGPSDTTDPFLFCGGTATHDIPGLASAPLRFSSSAIGESVVSVSGVFGSDFDSGGQGRTISLTTEVAGDPVCASRTDGAGHARRFRCNLPADTTLGDIVLRLRVERDRPVGVFAGIGNLRAKILS